MDKAREVMVGGVAVDHATEAVWGQLRGTRWNPPGRAATADDRRATYVAALEQAEQMFRAAATVGPATRPLLIFYGLSQAGRAIAATATSIESGDGWTLKGHGISSLGLDRHLPDLELHTGTPTDRGSFVRLSRLLDSPLWGKAAVRLNELWDVLPGNEHSPLLDTGNARRTPLGIDHRGLHDEPHPLASVPVIGFPPWVVNADNGQEALDDYLKSFPEAQSYDSFLRHGLRDRESAPAFSIHRNGRGELLMHWRLPDGRHATRAERLAYLETLARPHDGFLYFFPAVVFASRSVHPLMAWWGVLHALSMLARYHPEEWASHISVDASPHAVAIERLLNDALRVLPRLVAEAIDEVAGLRRIV